MTDEIDQFKAGTLRNLCETLAGRDISNTAKLIAVLEAAGYSREDIERYTDSSPATYRRAKAALKNDRSKMSDGAQKCAPALKNEQGDRSKMSAPLKNEREASRGVESHPTTVEVVDTNTPTTPTPIPPYSPPFSPSPSVPVAKVCKRGARLPDDWKLPVDWQQWARVNFPATSAEAVTLEADKFRDFWCSKAGQGATKLDWQATWRNWCRTAFAAKPGRQPVNNGRSAYDERMARQREQVARIRAQFGGVNATNH